MRVMSTKDFVFPDQLRKRGYTLEVVVAHTRERLPRRWIERVIKTVLEGERVATATITCVLCDDNFIRKLNREYLRHNWATDVLSFLLDEHWCEGEIYISVDTALRQAAEYGVSLRNELGRLAAHGVLHLVGYSDYSDIERERMRQLEDRYLSCVARGGRCR